jgi:pimeloyl-ACP methyl ester carboxylesterase
MKQQLLTFSFLLVFLWEPVASANNQNFELVEFTYLQPASTEVPYARNGALFRTSTSKAVILAHQWGAKKESWYFLADILREKGIASLALQSSGTRDVLGAIDFMIAEGYSDITLVGASIGGGAILHALEINPTSPIAKVILLAPAEGPALQNSQIDKLVVVAEKDFFRKNSYIAYNSASNPKTLKEYTGAKHAQDLFESEHKEDLVTTIVEFLKKKPN